MGYSNTNRSFIAVMIILVIIFGAGVGISLILTFGPTTTTGNTTSTTSTSMTTTSSTTSEPTTSTTSTSSTTTSTTSEARTLRVLTRFDVAITTIYEDEFLDSDFAIQNNIVDIAWTTTAEEFWDDLIDTGQIDVCWGGSQLLFDQLAYDSQLSELEYEEIQSILDRFPQNTKTRLVGNYSGNLLWVGSTLLTFGITVNNQFLADYSLPKPQNWTDLANTTFGRHLPTIQTIAMSNAPSSTSNAMIYDIITQSIGWDAGWINIARMAGNAEIYGGAVETQVAAENGEVGVAMSIDHFGYKSMKNNEDCEYIVPKDGAYLEAMPIGIANTSANKDIAMGFVEFVMSSEGQSLMLHEDIGQTPIMEDAFHEPLGLLVPDMYSIYNETIKIHPVDFNTTEYENSYFSHLSYFEAVITDAHSELVQCWNAIVEAYYEGYINETEVEYYAGLMGALLTVQDAKTSLNETFTLDYAITINQDLLTDYAYLTEMQSRWTLAAMIQYVDVYNQIQTLILG